MLTFPNPKQDKAKLAGANAWYPYYAGFSHEFAHDLLSSSGLPNDAIVLDPWNGAGTTTAVAQRLGRCAVGVDINPVMIVAAKARTLRIRECDVLERTAHDLVAHARADEDGFSNLDPLEIWFAPSGAAPFRTIERAIHRIVTGEDRELPSREEAVIDKMSNLAAFYYTALFRTVRRYMTPFVPSNPTWTKRPKGKRNRLRPSAEAIYKTYREEVAAMAVGAAGAASLEDDQTSKVCIRLGSSSRLDLPDESIHFVLSSPPYCTRIDYAIATLPELAVLGFHPDREVGQLREDMIGSATVRRRTEEPRVEWGEACLKFLQLVRSHPSKASATYYYKNHWRYFAGMYTSLTEISRVTKDNGQCVLVAQDSYYKEVHNDLPTVLQEMMAGLGFETLWRRDHPVKTNMANVHPEARSYRDKRPATESVLSFRKRDI